MLHARNVGGEQLSPHPLQRKEHVHAAAARVERYDHTLRDPTLISPCARDVIATAGKGCNRYRGYDHHDT